MNKKAYFYIDDTIWVFRDLARTKPKSLFDVPLLKILKKAHDEYGMKTQLNLFYRTDYFYGNDEFSLADVPDTYKSEFEESSDWLKLAFHAKQEFPDYPHINATYEDIRDLFQLIEREVFRFAGKASFTYGVCPHWVPVSKAGVRALYDCGVRILDATQGETREYNGDRYSLPFGHAQRLLHNRQPETKVFTRGGRDVAIERSICGYNHLPEERGVDAPTLKTFQDAETGMLFKRYCVTCLNLLEYHELEDEFRRLSGNEYIGICNHEQYFYADYFLYQPDYAAKIYKICELLQKYGYEYMFAEDLI